MTCSREAEKQVVNEDHNKHRAQNTALRHTVSINLSPHKNAYLTHH